MITVEKLEKGTYFDDAFKISFRYDPTTVAKVKELAERRYLPERQKLVDNFQTNPQCKVAIGTIGAMGTGLTLNKASYVFFMDKAWNSGDNAQAEDRAHRIGTVGAVNVISSRY